MAEPRDRILERLHEDLVGPFAPDECIPDRPGDRYLTGILSPVDAHVLEEEDEQLGVGNGGDDEEGGGDEAVALVKTRRPSSAGLSFSVKPTGPQPRVRFVIRCGTYVAVPAPADPAGPVDVDDPSAPADRADASSESAEPAIRRRRWWQRTPHEVTLDLEVEPGHQQITCSPGAEGLALYMLCVRHDGTLGVTAVVRNLLREGPDRTTTEQRTFFQVELRAEPLEDAELAARPARRSTVDDDDLASELIYRDAHEFAVGHTAGATWETNDGRTSYVSTSWLPQAVVPAVRADGGDAFAGLSEGGLDPLSAAWLASASDSDLVRGLERLPAAWSGWLDSEEKRIDGLSSTLQVQARRHVETARSGVARMRASIRLLETDEHVRSAFRLANQAMQLQRRWKRGDDDLRWRPFQLGFQLLSLASIVDPDANDRDVVDLLWFPTGGGKTESYLGLVAFTLFHRRLAFDARASEGVSVLMRYTLRLLTVQQFQRAAALVLACEHLRRISLKDGGTPIPGVPFSIGLWVGGKTTPNHVRPGRDDPDAAEASANQLPNCPACGGAIVWEEHPRPLSIRASCRGSSCDLSRLGQHLPVWTVDDDVYRERPSLLIGTIDKFAQVVRNPDTHRLFGLDSPCRPPDLILQDELHLISGPLGTIAALYEAAIDRLCTREGRRPKVIGSTATIRRAAAQIGALFDRRVYQFPPPVLDADDSCFAVRATDRPGRQYVAVSSVGRSPKFTLQAVCASLLQSVRVLPLGEDERDWYWTLVAYFNALRELGGALVLMLDDVKKSMVEIARRRDGEGPAAIGVPTELTSRLRSGEIPEILDKLERLTAGDPGAYDAVLASNMISVGVDVDRLNLMVVAGQPKGIAEYIQATSRVGRRNPGLVVAVYNHGRVRDRSHFETFRTWHQTIYREVEATSVTPFASRAQDRALHAVLAALARHLVPDMLEDATLTPSRRAQLEALATEVVRRVQGIPCEVEEVPGLEQRIRRLLDDWEARGSGLEWWNEFRQQRSLLVSAEERAAAIAAGASAGMAWATPNSMRGVEPSTGFRLVNALRRGGEGDGRAS